MFFTPRAESVFIGPALMALTRMLFLPRSAREIADRRLESGLCHTHNIIARNDLFRSVITHSNNTSAIRHKRSGGQGHLRQRKCADLERRPKCVASRRNKFALESLFRCKSDRMNYKIQPAKFLPTASNAASTCCLIRTSHGTTSESSSSRQASRHFP